LLDQCSERSAVQRAVRGAAGLNWKASWHLGRRNGIDVKAPDRPLSRMRSNPWWVLRRAKRISTRLRSSRDFRKRFVCLLWAKRSSEVRNRHWLAARRRAAWCLHPTWSRALREPFP
jgi:hypothetical protein